MRKISVYKRIIKKRIEMFVQVQEINLALNLITKKAF